MSAKDKKILWLAETKKALDLYDWAWDKFCKIDFVNLSREDGHHELNAFKVLEQNVGLIFGIETSDRNGIIDCYKYVHPGPKNPSPGEELSMVRKLVNEWEKNI
jgi:hypothetical protein